MSVVGSVDAPRSLERHARAGVGATPRRARRSARTPRLAAMHGVVASRRPIDSTLIAHLEGEIARLIALVALAIVAVTMILPRLLEVAAAAGN
jgi:hypothetical protein